MIGFPPISSIARDLGAPDIKDDRCAAWYRGGNNPRSLKLDDDKACAYDFGKQEGGGIVWLVAKALDRDRRQAFDWLRERYDLKQDPAMRSRRQAVRSTAISLAEWRWKFAQGLRAVAIFIERDCRAIARWTDTQTDFSEDPRWELFSHERERLTIAEGIDAYARRLLDLPARDVLKLRQRLEVAR